MVKTWWCNWIIFSAIVYVCLCIEISEQISSTVIISRKIISDEIKKLTLFFAYIWAIFYKGSESRTMWSFVSLNYFNKLRIYETLNFFFKSFSVKTLKGYKKLFFFLFSWTTWNNPNQAWRIFFIYEGIFAKLNNYTHCCLMNF